MPSRNLSIRIQHVNPVLLTPEVLFNLKKLNIGLEIRDFVLPSLLDRFKIKEAFIEGYRIIVDQKIKISVHGPTMDLNLGSLDGKIRKISIERVMSSLEIAKRLSSDFVIIHSNYNPIYITKKERYDEWVGRMLKSYQEIDKKFKNRGVNLCIENSPSEPLVRYLTLLNLIKINLKNINIFGCLDYDHLNNVDKRRFFSIADPLIIYLHVPEKIFLCADKVKKIFRMKNVRSICLEGSNINSMRLEIIRQFL